MLDQIVQSLIDQSVLGIILAIILFVGIKSLIFVGKKLFDNEYGLVTLWVKSQQKLMASLEAQGDRQQDLCNLHVENLTKVNLTLEKAFEFGRQHDEGLQTLVKLYQKADKFETVKTNKTLQDILDAAAGAIDAALIISQSFETLDNGKKRKVEELLRNARTDLQKTVT
jgi:hypothetical protein